MTTFWGSVTNFWNQIVQLFSDMGLSDYIDIIIVALIAYEVIILVRHTRAQQVVVGVTILIFAWLVADAAELRVLSKVLGAIMQFGIVVLAIIFQPELRRAVEQVGGINSIFTKFFKGQKMEDGIRAQWQSAIVSICDSAEMLAEKRVGALMVLERGTNLNEIIRTGTPIHGDVNVETLGTIFYEGTPLHDGAVVIRDGRIEAAACFLPLSNNLEISKDMGTRHRSALGMSENSDAIVVVVSEETGIISLAKNGVMIRRLDRQNLFNLLISDIIPPQKETQKKGFLSKIGLKEDKKEASSNEKAEK